LGENQANRYSHRHAEKHRGYSFYGGRNSVKTTVKHISGDMFIRFAHEERFPAVLLLRLLRRRALLESGIAQQGFAGRDHFV